MDELARLMESHAARRRAGDGRHDRGIHAVRVDRNVVLPPVRHAIEDRVHPNVVQFVCCDDVRAIGLRNGHFLRPCAALRANADLENVLDVIHFRRAPDRA